MLVAPVAVDTLAPKPMAVFSLPPVVAIERTDPDGGVVDARGVAEERIDSDGGVVLTRGVVNERTGPRWRC